MVRKDFSMLKNIYNNLIRKKIINKMFFVNVIITSTIMFILSYYVIDNFTRMTIDKELKHNTVVLNSINDYISNKYSIVKAISTQLYYDKFSANSKYLLESNNMDKVFNFIQTDIDNMDLKYMENKQAFDNYFASVFARDDDIAGINIFKLADGKIYQYTKLINNTYSQDSYKHSNRLKQIEDPYKPMVIIHHTVYPEYYDLTQSLVFTLSVNLKSLDLKTNIGILMVDFNEKGFSKLISMFYNDLKYEIIVLSKDAQIIYDSSRKYYGMEYPHFNLLVDSMDESTVKIEGKNYIIKREFSPDTGIVIAGIISEEDLLENVKSIKYSIYFALLASVLICIVLMNASSKMLSRRVTVIVSKLKEFRKCNFSVKIPVSTAYDELDNIAISLNHMSEDLSKHIEKEYIMELRQKNAELTALQTQINPHFLYNTLETIKMKAVKNGDTTVGKMIYTLAVLFRSSVKSRPIIKVQDEIKYIELYLELFKIRYEAKFTYCVHVDNEVMGYAIPKLLLQPIVENYFMHGFNAKADDSIIFVGGCMQNQVICFTIKDNGNGIDPVRLVEIKKHLNNDSLKNFDNIGLLNVSERIKIIYGTNYGINIESEPGKGTKVLVRIPSMSLEELNLHVQSINS